MVKVLISDKMSPAAAQIFRDRGIEVDEKFTLTKDELIACIGEYDGLAIRSSTKVTADILAAAKNLKVVGRAGIGVDNVDVPAATANGVIVMNTPYGNAITTAEHAISMMMALAREIPVANASTHAGKWEKNRFMGVELYGKTLGVIGCGNIGSIVCDRALGLKMKVMAYDPYLSPDRARDLGVEKVELEQIFTRSDFITLHTPLTDSTRNVIGTESFKKMKKGVRIINCARGGLVDEAALQLALESGQVAGAALDVFETEPAKSHPLFGNEKVVCTPHLGASTNEAQENVALQVAEQMADYLLTGAITNALNMASVSAEEAPKLRPYMKLVEWLGSLAGQITESGLKAVTLELEGHAAEVNSRPLVSVALDALLSPLIETVNVVNAPLVAKERNIDVRDTRRERTSSDYHTMIRLTVETERQSRTLAGTLVGGRPRIVEVNGVDVEASLAEHMLYIINIDRPGFIGALGTCLGENKINIASFHLGRREEGGEAVSLIQVDQAVSPDVIAKISALDQVKQVKALHFNV